MKVCYIMAVVLLGVVGCKPTPQTPTPPPATVPAPPTVDTTVIRPHPDTLADMRLSLSYSVDSLTVTGTVSLPDGSPNANAIVTLVSTSKKVSPIEGSTDAVGKFTIKAAKGTVGTYQVCSLSPAKDTVCGKTLVSIPSY